MILLTIASANAYVLARTCDGLAVADTVPSASAVDVPVDARIALVFGDAGCTSALGWTTALTDATGAPVPTTLGPGSDDPDATWLIELFPEDVLAPDTAYTLTMTPPDAGEVAEIGFTTGSGTVAGLTGEPTFTVQGIDWEVTSANTLGEARVRLTVEPAEDPDHLSVIQVQDANADSGIQSFRAPETGSTGITATWVHDRRPAEVCPQVRQIDGAGVATEWSEPQCEAVPLCGTASGAPALGLVLLGALGAGVRRRGR